MMRSTLRPHAETAVTSQAGERRQVVRLASEAVGIELFDRRIVNHRCVEALQRRAARLGDTRRLELEPRLVRRDLARLSRAGLPLKFLDSLPSEPGELVVVPHVDEGPVRARVLHIRVVKIGSIDRPIVVECRRDVKV